MDAPSSRGCGAYFQGCCHSLGISQEMFVEHEHQLSILPESTSGVVALLSQVTSVKCVSFVLGFNQDSIGEDSSKCPLV